MKRLLVIGAAVALAGCASVGGTRGGADYRPAWYKHPTTGDVQKCDCGFYPGAQWSRYACGKRWTGRSYSEVEKSTSDMAGSLCVAKDEIRAVEDRD